MAAVVPAMIVFAALSIVAASSAQPVLAHQPGLTLEQRVEAQQRVEEVYWRYRVWPERNPGPKPALSEVLTPAAIRAKVETQLAREAALAAVWGVTIGAGELQAELGRMTRSSRAPARLGELRAAAEAAIQAHPGLTGMQELGGDYRVVTGPERDAGRGRAPDPPDRSQAALPRRIGPLRGPRGPGAERHGTARRHGELGQDRLRQLVGSGSLIESGLPPVGRADLGAVWTGTEMIVWGGADGVGTLFNSGGRYDPGTDSWSPTSTGSNVPGERLYQTAVWTGSEMIVWGGSNWADYLQTGGRYDPATDSWQWTSTAGDCPSGRPKVPSIWTGREMIIWGGWWDNTSARYDPATDSWRALSTGDNSPPDARSSHSAVWTGLDSEMIVWAGEEFDTVGYRYCAAVVHTWYADDDSHGYGDPLDTTDSRTQPAGYVVEDGDCDDANAAVHPGVVEEDPFCADGVDNDCDTVVPADEFDDDSDGHRVCDGDCDESVPPAEADADSDGTRVCDGDCNDADGSIHPGATEIVADGVDQDCDTTELCYADGDGDGHGVPATVVSTDLDCDDTNETTLNDDDCDGADPDTYPGAPELCDGIDNDCDGAVPANESDTDSDGFQVCEGDCDDSAGGIHPGAEETCNGIDDDCDGSVPSNEADADSDGYRVCENDCDDGNASRYPGNEEVCDGLDNDCDGAADLEDFDDCGSSRTVCSTLGNQPAGNEIDEDVWIVSGTAGEVVDVLAVATHGMGNANLILMEAGGGQPEFVEVDRSRLPNRIHVTLPASGLYVIAVSEQHDVALVPGRRFAGDYCLTLDASMGGSLTLRATDLVEPGDAAASAQPSVQPGRVPRALRDPAVRARTRGR